ncbi:TerB family tellurite resistance protein [Flavobacterium sp.]|uniref:TerB family tellurite resistance protein n=1 Tax=Flavobacterium sp. TaxID=239 RepID=UPI004033A6FC
MKTKTYLMLFVFLMASIPRANAQAQELKQLALNIEKLSQFRAILRDMKKGYEILTEGYNTVKDLTEGNFNLHKTFLDKLLQVSPAVRNYKRVADIIEYQINLVQEYGRHKNRLTSSGLFNNNELAYFNNVYDKLFDDSLKDLDELTNVMTAGKLRMSDEERLEAIDRIYVSMQEKLLFLRDFNSDTTVLAIQRAREARDVEAIRLLTGTNH